MPPVHSTAPGGLGQHLRGCHGNRILEAEPNIALYDNVLPEALGQRVQLGTHLGKAVKLLGGIGRRWTVAGEQELGELGAQVVTHLGQSWLQPLVAPISDSLSLGCEFHM